MKTPNLIVIDDPLKEGPPKQSIQADRFRKFFESKLRRYINKKEGAILLTHRIRTTKTDETMAAPKETH